MSKIVEDIELALRVLEYKRQYMERQRVREKYCKEQGRFHWMSTVRVMRSTMTEKEYQIYQKTGHSFIINPCGEVALDETKEKCNAPFPDADYIQCDQDKDHTGINQYDDKYPTDHSVTRKGYKGKTETITWKPSKD